MAAELGWYRVENSSSPLCIYRRERGFFISASEVGPLRRHKQIDEYGLTELGTKMLPIVNSLADFGNYYKSIIEQN